MSSLDPTRRVRLDDFNSVAASGVFGELTQTSSTKTSRQTSTSTKTSTQPSTNGNHPAEPIHSWQSQRLVQLANNPPEPPLIGRILYPGKRTLLSGETESLKTWFALILCKAEIDIEQHVAWADLDAMGAGELLDRLRILGVTDPAIDKFFHFYEPTDRLVEQALADTIGLITEHRMRLFVIDALNSMLGLHGLDPSSTPDVEAFWREIADPITDAGAAPTCLDHVVKNAENRGKYAYGAERKASGAIVHIGFQTLENLSRSQTGKTLLRTHKDRPGHLPRPTIGRLVLTPNEGKISYRLDADHSREGGFRPTHLMERVSDYLEASFDAPSRNQIEDHITGKASAVRAAIDVLVAEGYAEQTNGARGAKLITSKRPFSEADDDYEPTENDTLGDVSTSSRPRPTLESLLFETHVVPRPSSTKDEDEDGVTTTSSSRDEVEVIQPSLDADLEVSPPALPDDAPEWEKNYWANAAEERRSLS